MNEINIRLYVETEAESGCESAIDTIKNHVNKMSHNIEVKIGDYWKIQEYKEINISFPVDSLNEDEFIEFVNEFSEKWVFESNNSELSAMWHPDIGAPINIPNVKWMFVTVL